MYILIKDMEMPQNCLSCPLQGGTADCRLTQKTYNWGLNERPSDCPLVPVPQHGRCIDADALEDNNITYYAIPVFANVTDATIREAELVIRLKDLDNAPTIIPAEEVTEE